MDRKITKIMIVAGEASGDLHAAKLVDALRGSAPDVDFEFFGAAGEKMRAAGVEAVVKSDALSIVGLLEIGLAIGTFLKALLRLRTAAATRNPDVVILVDFPDFNLKLAKWLHGKGFRVVYYISPQLWAWRKYRLRTIRKHVDLLISILPFEKSWFAGHGVSHVEYVGSPLAREVFATMERDEFCRLHALDPAKPIVSLLPGSRHKEIVRILPPMLEAAALLTTEVPAAQFVIALASDRNRRDAEAALARAREKNVKLPEILLSIQGETFNALKASDVAAVTSGTATLETGIIGTPMAIVYKTSAVNYKLLRPLIEVEHFGLVNLIAEERVAAELIQDDFTPASLSAELRRLLEPDVNEQVRERLRMATDKLGHGGASKRAAEAILRLLDFR